jgi:steroid delta-isomerase-like uncharacterized protein
MDHTATVERAFELINAGDIDGFGDLMAENFVEHEQVAGLEPTKEGTKQLFRMLVAGFPDLRFDVEDILSTGDKVTARLRLTGSHNGEFMGIPATGKSINIQAIDILKFDADGLVDEHWGVTDIMSMMQQLGGVTCGARASGAATRPARVKER